MMPEPPQKRIAPALVPSSPQSAPKVGPAGGTGAITAGAVLAKSNRRSLLSTRNASDLLSGDQITYCAPSDPGTKRAALSSRALTQMPVFWFTSTTIAILRPSGATARVFESECDGSAVRNGDLGMSGLDGSCWRGRAQEPRAHYDGCQRRDCSIHGRARCVEVNRSTGVDCCTSPMPLSTR